MEGWQQDWWKMLETVAEEIERFVTSIVEELESAADALIDFTEEVAEQVEQALTPAFDETDDTLDEWIDPLLAFINSIEATMGEVAAPVTHTVEPMLNQHAACVGCRQSACAHRQTAAAGSKKTRPAAERAWLQPAS